MYSWHAQCNSRMGTGVVLLEQPTIGDSTIFERVVKRNVRHRFERSRRADRGAATQAAWTVIGENSSAGEGRSCSPREDKSTVPCTLTNRGNGNRCK